MPVGPQAEWPEEMREAPQEVVWREELRPGEGLPAEEQPAWCRAADRAVSECGWSWSSLFVSCA